MGNNGYKFLDNINYLVVLFVLLQVVFCVVCVNSISALMTDGKVGVDDYVDKFSVDIKDINELQDGLTADQISTIQRSLLDVVRRNASQINLSSNDAEVRDGSVMKHHFNYQDLSFVSAILDIPSLEQSYQVFYEYSNDSNNRFLSPNESAIILCLEDQDEIIYEGFECNNIYDVKVRNRIVAKYIKYFSFSDFIVNVDTDNFETVNIYVIVDGASEQDKERYVESVRGAIRSLGISPDLFRYNLF